MLHILGPWDRSPCTVHFLGPSWELQHHTCTVLARPLHFSDACDIFPFYLFPIGKHEGSSAQSHNKDLRHLYTLDEFEKLLKHNGVAKPILSIHCDGGPDESPRHDSVRVAISISISGKYRHSRYVDFFVYSVTARGLHCRDNEQNRSTVLSGLTVNDLNRTGCLVSERKNRR